MVFRNIHIHLERIFLVLYRQKKPVDCSMRNFVYRLTPFVKKKKERYHGPINRDKKLGDHFVCFLLFRKLLF